MDFIVTNTFAFNAVMFLAPAAALAFGAAVASIVDIVRSNKAA